MSINTYKRKTNVLMKLTEQDHKDLSRPGWEGLEKFKLDQGNHTYWFNVGFRLKFASELTAQFYESVTSLPVKLTTERWLNEYSRAAVSIPCDWNIPLAYKKELIDDVSAVLEALEVVQRELLRKDMAVVIRKVAMEMRSKYAADVKLNPLPPKRLK